MLLSRLGYIDTRYSEPILLSTFSCRFIIALNRTVILLRNWLMTLMTMTRLYAIRQPFQSTVVHTKRFYLKLNLGALLLLSTVFISINIYGVMMLNYVEATNDNVYPECRIRKSLYERFEYIDAIINFLLGIVGYILPCLMALVVDIALIHTIRQKAMHKQNSSNFLLVFSTIYVLCYMPYSIVFLIFSLDLFTINVNVIMFVTHLRYLNHVVTFYIYLATGKSFRKDLKSILLCKK